MWVSMCVNKTAISLMSCGGTPRWCECASALVVSLGVRGVIVTLQLLLLLLGGGPKELRGGADDDDDASPGRAGVWGCSEPECTSCHCSTAAAAAASASLGGTGVQSAVQSSFEGTKKLVAKCAPPTGGAQRSALLPSMGINGGEGRCGGCGPVVAWSAAAPSSAAQHPGRSPPNLCPTR